MSEQAAGSAVRSDSLQSIQILRAVAALGVLAYHVSRELAERTPLTGFLSDILVGAAGVDLFFVVSGFVMVHASEALFAQRGAPRYFLVRRLARIVPLYWAATALLLVYNIAAQRAFPPPFISTEGVIASFAFFPWPLANGIVAPLHALGWTLNYEMFFYVVFAGAILLPRRAAVLAIVAVFAALVVMGLLVPLPQPLAFWFAPVILEFCFGMVIALAYRSGVRLPRAARYALLAGALAGYAVSIKTGYSLSLRFVAWGLPGAALVAAFVLSDARSSNPLARAVAFLGDASYSIYLMHPIAFPFVRRGLLPFLPVEHGFGQILYAALLVAAALALSVATYLWFERPITRALQRRIDRYRPPSARKSAPAEPALNSVAP